MSRLSDLGGHLAQVARANAGEADLQIAGGPSAWGVPNATGSERGFDDLVHQRRRTVRVVIHTAEFMKFYPADPATYIGKAATLAGESFRVERITKGTGFVRVLLVDATESP